MHQNPLDRSRLGHCYPLAGRYVMDIIRGRRSAPLEETFLVHGSIQGFGQPRIDHAWVIVGDNVYEPATDQEWDAYVFNQLFNAIPGAAYSPDQVLDMMCKHMHWGPWDQAPLPKRKRKKTK